MNQILKYQDKSHKNPGKNQKRIISQNYHRMMRGFFSAWLKTQNPHKKNKNIKQRFKKISLAKSIQA